MKLLITIISSLLFIGWGSVRIIKGVQFNRECGGYLERAANANTIQLASRELKIAIDYLNKNGITDGYTSIIYKTPDEDVGYWHENLEASLDDLNKVSGDATQLEISNVLMKLRETLMDHGNGGERITIPMGVSIFPDNSIFCFAGWGFAIFALAGLIKMAIDEDF